MSTIQRTLIGDSPQLVNLRASIARVAPSEAKILITGESGVGKELVAGAIHAQSLRERRPFVPVNCAGLPETLLETELFGHVKGSFTGAYRDKPGKLEVADGGTIFLDEIGEMTLRMQGLVLRVLETGELQKVGADKVGRRVNVRVIAATNRDLRKLVTQGAFREDLFYRINVINIDVPPLRDRRSDVRSLVEHFLERFRTTTTTVVKDVSPEAMSALTAYSWPGNVRELANVIERVIVTCNHPVVGVADLPSEVQHYASTRGPATHTGGVVERRRTVADELYGRLVEERQSFWATVYPLYMQREITRGNVRDLVRKGLREARGNYKIVLRMFNMEDTDYKKFLNFLRKHDCQLPFKEYRQ